MDVLDEVGAIIFFVNHTLWGTTWKVRLKQCSQGDKSLLTILNATNPETGHELTGAEWEKEIREEGTTDAFWSAVIHAFLVIAGGGHLGKA